MAIVWTNKLAVGVDKIDDQHKLLFEKVNDLFEACRLGKGKSVIGDMLLFLKEYTQKHFTDEETYMLRIHYPEYSKQKVYHQNFIKELEKLNHEFTESGNELNVILSVNQFIFNWLTQHISKEDKKIGDFVKNL